MRTLSLWLACAVLASAADDVPGWVRELATAKQESFDKTVAAHVLLAEELVEVGPDGKTISTRRGAIRVLTREGRSEAIVRSVYVSDHSKVRDIRGWIVHPSGEPKKLGKSEIADAALVDNDVYNEVRQRVLSASGLVDAGAVFAYETIVEERSVFSQRDFDFQDNLPARLARFSITVPAGWRAESVTFNHAPLAAAVSGGTHTWEMRNLPAIPREDQSPGLSALVPRVAVSLYPPEGATDVSMVPFRTWPEVARWLSTLNETQLAADAALTAKVQLLSTGSAADRMAAMGKVAQQIRYVSIQTGIGRGGGYKPHAAADVFAKQYGDCKDKANLMRAMLKVAGFESWPVSVYSGSPWRVRPEWPSPQQFNHAILAVRAPDGFDSPAVLAHPQFGRIVFFDPTADHVSFGHLPSYLYGSYGLLVANSGGDLVKLPEPGPQTNREVRTVKVELTAEGGMKATVRDSDTGSPAFSSRSSFRSLPEAEFRKALERVFASRLSGASITQFRAEDSGADAFLTDIELTAPAFGKSMQGRLLMVPSTVLPRGTPSAFLTSNRTLPFVLAPQAYEETTEFVLPSGFAVDEMPEAVKQESEFGKLTSECKEHPGRVVCTTNFNVPRARHGVEKFAAAREFFGLAGGAMSAPIVLIRK